MAPRPKLVDCLTSRLSASRVLEDPKAFFRPQRSSCATSGERLQLRHPSASISALEQQFDRCNPSAETGMGTSTRLRLPQSVHSNSTQAGFDADVAASSSVR